MRTLLAILATARRIRRARQAAADAQAFERYALADYRAGRHTSMQINVACAVRMRELARELAALP